MEFSRSPSLYKSHSAEDWRTGRHIHEEDELAVGGDFCPPCMAGERGSALVRRGEYSACTNGAHLGGTVVPAEVVPSGSQWRAARLLL